MNDNLRIALSELCGQSGRELADEIISTDLFTPQQYNWVKNNIIYCTQESIEKHFGVIYYAYEFQYRPDLAHLADQQQEMLYSG